MRDYINTLFDSDTYAFITSDPTSKGRLYLTDTISDAQSGFITVNSFLKESSTRSRAEVADGQLRTFVLEQDNTPLAMQDEIIRFAKIPYSLKLFTGNKSVHYILTLTERVPVDMYLQIAEQLKAYTQHVLGRQLFDCSVLRPEVISRLPGTVHSKTGNKAELLEVRERVSIKQLAPLLKIGEQKLTEKLAKQQDYSSKKSDGCGYFSFSTQEFFRNPPDEGNRHYQLLKAAKDSYHRGVNIKRFIDKAIDSLGYDYLFGSRTEIRTVLYAYEIKMSVKEAEVWYNNSNGGPYNETV